MEEEKQVFKCASCGVTFEAGWSDEEAKKEAREKFGIADTDINAPDIAVICDPCFQKLNAAAQEAKAAAQAANTRLTWRHGDGDVVVEGAMHLLDNSRKGEPLVWYCSTCDAVTVEQPPLMPTCGSCAALPCRGCALRSHGATEVIMMGVAETSACKVHDWPTEGMPGRMLEAAKTTGVQACRACIDRARNEAMRVLKTRDASRSN